MTDAAIITLAGIIVGAVAPTIMAYAALQQGKANGAKAIETSQKLDQNTATTEAVAVKGEQLSVQIAEVHHLADGNLTKMSNALDVANERIAGLERILQDKDAAAGRHVADAAAEKQALAADKQAEAAGKQAIAAEKQAQAAEKLLPPH